MMKLIRNYAERQYFVIINTSALFEGDDENFEWSIFTGHCTMMQEASDVCKTGGDVRDHFAHLPCDGFLMPLVDDEAEEQKKYMERPSGCSANTCQSCQYLSVVKLELKSPKNETTQKFFKSPVGARGLNLLQLRLIIRALGIFEIEKREGDRIRPDDDIYGIMDIPEP